MKEAKKRRYDLLFSSKQKKIIPYFPNFGFVVDSNNPKEIIEKIKMYLEKKDLLMQYSKRARELAEEKYNWQKIEKDFINFIEVIK